jgi:hypothetical protein
MRSAELPALELSPFFIFAHLALVPSDGFDREHALPVLPLLLSLYSSHTRQETEVEEDEQCTHTRNLRTNALAAAQPVCWCSSRFKDSTQRLQEIYMAFCSPNSAT